MRRERPRTAYSALACGCGCVLQPAFGDVCMMRTFRPFSDLLGLVVPPSGATLEAPPSVCKRGLLLAIWVVGGRSRAVAPT